MRTGRMLIVCLLALAAGESVCVACTGLAVYSERPVYGMNFDYSPDVPVRLLIDDAYGVRTFHMAFVTGPRRMPRTVGMNEHGLFVSTQELHPMVKAGPPGDGQQCPGGLYHQALREFSSVTEVEGHLQTTRVVDCYDLTLHLLLADPEGRAIVVEPGVGGHEITEVSDGRLVMTNFANCRFAGADRDSIYGVGAERYRTAHDLIEERFDGFDVDDAMDVLAAAASEWTRTSMVFDPLAGEVFVALEGDFSRIFRVSIEEATVETHTGFDEHESWKLGRFGVSTAVLAGADPTFLDRVIDLFTW